MTELWIIDPVIYEEARDIRYVIHLAGGMATKTAVEDVLLARHATLNRADAHAIMNWIEFNDIDRFVHKRHFEGAPPTIADYPEINQAHVPFLSGEGSIK